MSCPFYSSCLVLQRCILAGVQGEPWYCIGRFLRPECQRTCICCRVLLPMHRFDSPRRGGSRACRLCRACLLDAAPKTASLPPYQASVLTGYLVFGVHYPCWTDTWLISLLLAYLLDTYAAIPRPKGSGPALAFHHLPWLNATMLQDRSLRSEACEGARIVVI